MLLVETAGTSGYSEWSNQASNLKSSLKLADWVISHLVINQHQQQNVASVSSSSPSTKALSSKASSPNPPCAKSVNFFRSQLPLPVTVTLRVVGPSTNLDLKIENDKHRKNCIYTRVGHAYAKYAKCADYAHMRNMRMRNMRMRIENLLHIFHIQREKWVFLKGNGTKKAMMRSALNMHF